MLVPEKKYLKSLGYSKKKKQKKNVNADPGASQISEESAKVDLAFICDIRISRDLSNHEKQHVEARKCIVQKCLQKFHIECPKDNVPTIAVLGSGGGLRALIALQGTLRELQEHDMLDIVMYLCGVSGSTWCMSYIYENEEWGKQLKSLEEKLCEKLVDPHRDWIKALKNLIESSKDDTYSLTDFWGCFAVYKIIHELDDHHLSDEQTICKNGIVPYPIYAAVDATKLDDAANRFHSDIWFEFTPHESGFFNPGAFVDVTYLGSKFNNGKLKEKKNEKKMTYLRGLWGSAAADFKKDMKASMGILIGILIDILKKFIFYYEASEYRCSCVYCKVALETIKFFLDVMESQTCMMENKTHADVKKHITNITEILENKGPSDTYNFCCTLKEIDYSLDLTENGKHILKLVETLQLEFTDTHCSVSKLLLLVISELEMNTEKITMQESNWEFLVHDIWDIVTFMYKSLACILTWKWGTISNYTYKCIDLKDKDLTDKTNIQLVDAAFVINSAYPLILRPERKVKLILSFDFSEGDPFETIKEASQYCKENKLPFPEIDARNLDKDKDNPEDCYIFRSNGCPTVMHFPLFNKVNCEGHVSDWRNRYKTISTSYPEQDIQNLLEAAKINVRNNAEKILQTLKSVANP
ncbi:cytosolic phospholipase A2 gamma-like [Thamnophis elegans]|uniref:cytosolic phospholipase A2 gamma-like n=1 Tax=Thamnophis elegans TaxID=35005 RepID=UPI00137768B9|nr:cytosolic phospholipase A2 gamma-like [Thamnophis elegans]